MSNTRLKIAVNTRLLLKGKLEGIGWFSYETLKRIAIQHPEHDFYFIFDRPFDQEFIFAPNVKGIYLGPQARHPVLWYVWFQWSVPYILKKIQPDLYLSPDGYMPLGLKKIKKLIVIHDIAYEHFPESVPKWVYRYYHYFFPKFAKEATRIATVSNYSKKDISTFYKVDLGKIDEVFNGSNSHFHPITEKEKIAIKKKWTNGSSYFVYIGGIYPRKNIERLFQAFEIFKKNDNQNTKLVIIGKKAFGAEKAEEIRANSPYKEDIIFTGRIEELSEVNALISASIAMTYVSIFEGFGIPCLEAMKAGTAVMTSNTSSMPEVCGDAALYIDPFSIESIAEGLTTLSNNQELRNDLIEKGFVQATKFNWDCTADLLWKSVLKSLSL